VARLSGLGKKKNRKVTNYKIVRFDLELGSEISGTGWTNQDWNEKEILMSYDRSRDNSYTTVLTRGRQDGLIDAKKKALGIAAAIRRSDCDTLPVR